MRDRHKVAGLAVAGVVVLLAPVAAIAGLIGLGTLTGAMAVLGAAMAQYGANDPRRRR